jgi:hypothetical protein
MFHGNSLSACLYLCTRTTICIDLVILPVVAYENACKTVGMRNRGMLGCSTAMISVLSAVVNNLFIGER